MAAIIVAWGGTAGNREHVIEGRGFFSTHINLFWMPEDIIRTYRLPSHVIFNLIQEIKDDLEYQSIKTSSKPSFLASGSFQWWLLYFFILYLRLHQFALRLVYCVGQYVNEMLRLCSLICTLLVNHTQKFPLPLALFWNCALALICPV